MAPTTTRTVLSPGVTFDSSPAGAFTVVKLPTFGTATREMAAKIVRDGRPVAVIMSPRVRWELAYGAWSRYQEDVFRQIVREIADHFGGEAVIPYDPR